jgi:hypothetical protein
MRTIVFATTPITPTGLRPMSFLIRFAACALAVLSMSILAAVAWDDSDQAAAAQAQGTVQATGR